MTEEPAGVYRTMDFGELSVAYDSLGEAAQLFRPVANTDIETEAIFQAAVGPTLVSTSTTLVPMKALPIWDVNGYYRAIGVSWPYRPTRKQMMEAYRDSDGGNNTYATYAFQRLRDDELRSKYDRRRLGEPMDDLFRWQDVRRMAADFAAQQSAQLGRAITIDDILGEDLVSRMKAQVEAERQVSEKQSERKNKTEDEPEVKPEVEPEREVSAPPFVWPYAYYLWNSRAFDDERLSRWQEMLVAACIRRGLSLQVAVGYLGRTRADAARVRHRQEGAFVEILFLHEDKEPTPELADVVVATYHTHPYQQPLDHPLYLYDHS